MKHKKKIVIVYSGAKYWGGIETYLANLFEYNDKDKIDLRLISLGNWPLTDSILNTQYSIQLLSGKRIRLRTIFEIAKFLKHERVDLVVSQGMVANFYARKASFLTKVPSLVVVHSELKNDYPNPFVRYGFVGTDFLMRWITKRYIVVSKYLRNELVSSGIDSQKVEVIYNGIDKKISNFPPERPLGRAGKFQISNLGGINLVSIGRLHKVKNFDSLIRAMKYLPEEARLQIWGEGEEKENLERLIKEQGLGSRVELMGYAKNIDDVLAEADIYVQPSHSEGFGLSVVEAMLAGTPVVVTPGGSLVELVEQGVTGIVADGFDPKAIAKGMKVLVEDRALAARLSEKAKQKATENFSIRTWIEKTTKVLLGATK